MQKDINLNVTMNGKCEPYKLPVEEEMTLEEFFISLQILLKGLDGKATTFDIYDTSFKRIAMVGNDEELFIDEAYENLNTMGDLFNVCIDTIEVIALGTSSVKKVLQEEKLLQEALDNYKFD